MPGIKGTMHEFRQHKLHSGSKHGPIVKSRSQAIAIGLSEERKEGHKVSKHHSSHHSSAPEVAMGRHPKANHHRHAEHYKEHHHKGHPHHHEHKHHVDHGFGHSHLRSQDNPHSDAKQAKPKSTGEQSMKGKKLEPAHQVFEFVEHECNTKARHHPNVPKAADRFARPTTGHTHGFGHAAHQRHGALRMSGVEGAHRIGKRK